MLTSGTISSTNGMRISLPSPVSTTSRSCAGIVLSAATFPTTWEPTLAWRPSSSCSYQPSSSSSSRSSVSMKSLAPRISSAALRSATSSKPSKRMSLFQRALRTVNGPEEAGSTTNSVPATNRSAGASVSTWTVTSPRMPWGLPIRATWSCMGSSEFWFHPRAVAAGVFG